MSNIGSATRGASRRRAEEAAEEALRMEQRCPICLDELDRPVELPCQHRFCRSCLQTAFEHQARERLSTRAGVRTACPSCRLPVLLGPHTFMQEAAEDESNEDDEHDEELQIVASRAPLAQKGTQAKEDDDNDRDKEGQVSAS